MSSLLGSQGQRLFWTGLPEAQSLTGSRRSHHAAMVQGIFLLLPPLRRKCCHSSPLPPGWELMMVRGMCQLDGAPQCQDIWLISIRGMSVGEGEVSG